MHTRRTQPERQELQPIMHQPTKTPSSLQPAIQHPHFLPSDHRNSGHLALPGGGTDTRGRKTSLVTRERPPTSATCSSSCPLQYRGEMRSHSKTRSLPASLLQFVIFIFFLMSSCLVHPSRPKIISQLTGPTSTSENKKDGYRQQNVRQR